MLFPFLSFSQQEEPKRVSVVVTVKEITPQKEVVQIPADNTPKAVGKPVVKKIATAVKSATPKEKLAAAAPTVATAKPIGKPSIVTPKNTIAPNQTKTEEITKSKSTEVKKEKTTEPAIVQPPLATAPKKEIEAREVESNKAEVKANNQTRAAVTAANENKEILEIPNNSKANSFSYIWIGIFLIVAGVVLGLLFGKPALLISFVGIVFVVLGIII